MDSPIELPKWAEKFERLRIAEKMSIAKSAALSGLIQDAFQQRNYLNEQIERVKAVRWQKTDDLERRISEFERKLTYVQMQLALFTSEKEKLEEQATDADVYSTLAHHLNSELNAWGVSK